MSDGRIQQAKKSSFLQIAEDFVWLNPHLALTLNWFGEARRFEASDPKWKKWEASDPTSAHWYSREQFERLIAAYIKHDQDHGQSRTVREFVSTFRGLSGSAKQKAVLDATGLAREPLSRLISGDRLDPVLVERLRQEMQRCSKPVKAAELGVIGEVAFRRRLEAAGCEMASFEYRKELSDKCGQPAAIEAAFAWNKSAASRRRILGVNWSAAISDPFRQVAHRSLDGILQEQRCGSSEPIMVAVHVAMPQAQYTDRGKSAVAIDHETGKLIEKAVERVTKAWAKQRKAEQRNGAAWVRRWDALARAKKVSIKEAAAMVMEEAYLHASAKGSLPAHARQVMYAARPRILELTGKETLDDAYFTQTLLPDYIRDHSEKCRDWNVVFDARGNLIEPHTQRRVPLGTLEIRKYLKQSAGHLVCSPVPDVREDRYPTCGPQHRYGDILFIEKEGFMPLFNEVRLAERYDIAIMSTKGMSVTASRELVDELCARQQARLLVLHDFDKAGFSIIGTLKRATRRYDFKNDIEVVDLGMRIGDIKGLQSEAAGIDPKARSAAKRNLAENGATADEIAFLLEERVELNAFASDALIAWIEGKLVAHGVRKVVPDEATLTQAYERAYRLASVQKMIRDMLASRGETAPIFVPPDLRATIEKQLQVQNSRTWDGIILDLADSAAHAATPH